MLPAWVADYVGLPFRERGRDRDGCDCYGLVRLIWRERAGLELPDYLDSYEATSEGEAISAAIEGELHTEDWRRVEAGIERLFDAVLIRMFFTDDAGIRRGAGTHCGMVVAPGVLIHVGKGINASLGFYRRDRLKWERRVAGFFRHAALEALP